MMSAPSITTWTFSKEGLLELAQKYADLEGTALFYSGGSLDSAQTSYLCLFPEKKVSLPAEKGCWEALREALGTFDGEGEPRWVGYLGYEMGGYADRDRTLSHIPSDLPGCCFYKPRNVVKFDHRKGVATLYGDGEALGERDPPIFPEEESYLSFSSDTLESYIEKINQAKEWILDGEIYQVNISQEFHLQGTRSPFKHFKQLCEINPAPFSTFINCGAFSIVSSSPERFLQRRENLLESRPIKGTAPRGKTPSEDQRSKKELLESEKERAELLMITDLMRNDIGKVSLPGSVETLELWRCESYSNVHHLLSIIRGESHPSSHSIELIRELFPGGSITGCPKLRAMEAITTLEGRPRGVYTGSIGYFAGNGDFDLSIAIRTLVFHPNHVQIQLGGGIVIDSDPIKEFEETLLKGYSLFTSLGVNVDSCLS